MQYIEISRKINLTKDVSEEELKQSLLSRLRRGIDVDGLRDQDGSFHIEGTTGGVDSITRHARVDLDVTVSADKETARFFIHGYSKMAKSLLLSYSFLFLLVLFTGLLPGSIETNGESSGAIDALVFLIFGIFIFYDINKKLQEPRCYLQAALDSMDTEFG